MRTQQASTQGTDDEADAQEQEEPHEGPRVPDYQRVCQRQIERGEREREEERCEKPGTEAAVPGAHEDCGIAGQEEGTRAPVRREHEARQRGQSRQERGAAVASQERRRSDLKRHEPSSDG